MKMNVYADKCALKYKKEGGVWKKDRPRVCDDKGLVFMQRVRYKLLGWPVRQVVIYQVYPYLFPPPHLIIGQ